MAEWLALAATLIVLDPGHSAKAPGALSARGRDEVVFNEEMAGLLERALAALPGVKVARTRAAGEELDLKGRAARAAGAALLLSVHHDSVLDAEEVPWDDHGTQRLHSAVARGFSLHVRADQPDAVRVARAIGHALAAAGFAPTRYHERLYKVIDREAGVYDRPNLALLKAATVPAVILECGFIIHRDEELELLDPARRARLVDAVVRAITSALPLPAIAAVPAVAPAPTDGGTAR
jgi:N-acetylmuramoyl-L-alanine amidase